MSPPGNGLSFPSSSLLLLLFWSQLGQNLPPSYKCCLEKKRTLLFARLCSVSPDRPLCLFYFLWACPAFSNMHCSNWWWNLMEAQREIEALMPKGLRKSRTEHKPQPYRKNQPSERRLIILRLWTVKLMKIFFLLNSVGCCLDFWATTVSDSLQTQT